MWLSGRKKKDVQKDDVHRRNLGGLDAEDFPFLRLLGWSKGPAASESPERSIGGDNL